MTAYYNENDPFAARWLRNLIDAGHIAHGDVDDRSISDVRPDELMGYTQCHFFAGIGGWSYALRLAGWPNDRPVWTGSCPCQPFSVAGKRAGVDDERHLWPDWRWLIDQCRPATIFGEQVASKDGRTWLSGVRSDLETMGYGVGAADLCAASIGAPHIRQRLWFVADSASQQAQRGKQSRLYPRITTGSAMGRALANAHHKQWNRSGYIWETGRIESTDCGVADSNVKRCEQGSLPIRSARQDEASPEQPGAGYWSSLNWIPCADGKARPIKPGIEPLAHGVSGILERLRSMEEMIYQELENYGISSKENAGQILQALRNEIQSEEGGEKQSARMLLKLYAPEVLLSFLLCLESAYKGSQNCSGFEKTSSEIRERLLRGMWSRFRLDDSSHQWRPNGQSSRESTDTVQILSFILAQHIDTYIETAYRANAAHNRVGRLRAYGNAIVPQVAAEFVKAYCEILTEQNRQ